MSACAPAMSRRFGQSRRGAPATDRCKRGGHDDRDDQDGKTRLPEGRCSRRRRIERAVGEHRTPCARGMLETGVRDDSVLAKVRKESVLRVGYAQTGPWFYKDAKTGE